MNFCLWDTNHANSQSFSGALGSNVNTGLVNTWSQEPKEPSDPPVASSNLCREPKDVPFDIHNTLIKGMQMQLAP